MIQNPQQAFIDAFPMRMMASADACREIRGVTGDRRRGADRRRSARWVARAIAVSKRRERQRLSAASNG